MDDVQSMAAQFDATRQAMVQSFGELLDTKALTPQEVEDEIEATRSALASLVAMKDEQ